MTPEASASFVRAVRDLEDARRIASIGLARVAARSAYYAIFHAAEALIVARTGKIAKSHSGVRSEFSRLLGPTPGEHRELITILGNSYRYKEIADYSLDPDARITDGDAEALISSASRFLASIEAMLSPPT